MGINLNVLFEKEEIQVKDLAGKKVAIDAFNALYQFISVIRQYNGNPLMDSKGNFTSHLSGVFYRTINLMKMGIKPCYVFDGKPPEFKGKTVENRIKIRVKAKEEYEKALKEKDFEMARKKAMQSSRLTKEMINESKELLTYMGIPVIQAPCEGEAQASYMANKGDVYACVSQDFDSLLFDAPILIRNLNITGRRKLPNRDFYTQILPQKIILTKELTRLGLTQDQLIMLGILVGTDFNPKGVYGIGPKKAYKLVKEKKTFEEVFNSVEWKFDISPKDIFDFFKTPPIIKDYELKWKDFDKEKIIGLLCDKHEFSRSRVENALNRLKEVNNSFNQLNLDKFF